MKTIFTLLTVLFTCSINALGQEPIDITDQTIKIGGFKEEELYFGFAAGDKIIFNFKEADNKQLKEVEIVEYPNSSKFSDYKTKLVENKAIAVTKQGVYVFRFKNSALGGRVCKIKIQRIPASEETRNFNPTVTWETKQETTYNTYTKDVIVGYDTTYIQKTKRVLVSTEQKEDLIVDKPQRVHSTSNGKGSKTALFFTLPQNQISLYKTTKVISWAYWVGVGEEANQAWKQNAASISNVVKGAATYFTTPLGALAIGAITDLMIPKVGEDVYYAISDQTNKDLFLSGNQYRIFDEGKGIAGFRKFTDQSICQGTYYVLLSNDNVVQGIDATVKVVAITETNIYEDQEYIETKVEPRYEKKTFSDPIVKTSKVPVTGK
ncbi:MAG: hypothetical protein J0H29_00040 [Sphingobacteriales bacterium]|nr:hypothetical protein [Sphingobacteriales bacterium]OJY85118.1 MAG: hypothetical protein BGP14_04560 [Sphingobacteriales bacterium 44-15]